MFHRRRSTALAAITVLLGSIGCADSTFTRVPETGRPDISGDPICTLPDPNAPLDPLYDLCFDPSPGHLAPDRAAFANGDELMTQVDGRADLSITELYWLEQEQGYQSLRAYLDPNEWTQASAEAGAASGSEDATGNEGVAYANDGVTRSDFPVGDGILSLLNARGEIQVGDSVYKLTRDNAYAVHVNDLALLREKVPTLSSPAPAEPDSRIIVQAVETTDSPVDEEPASLRSTDSGMASSLGVHTSNCHWQSGRYRMHGKSYITNALFYSEAGVRTEWERRKLFVFWSNTWQAGTLEYAYSTANLRLGTQYVFPTSGNGYQTGTSEVHKVITSGWFKQIRGTIYGTHTSSLGQCYTNVGTN